MSKNRWFMRFIEVKTTFEVEEEAKEMAEFLLNEKLIACGQIAKIESHYNWNGKRFCEREFFLIMKTKKSLFKELEKTIKAKHSYEVAEIIATPISHLSKEYADWIISNTK